MDYVDAPSSASSRAFAFKVHGRGMEPEFFEGEIVIVDPDKPYKHNDFVVLILEGRAVPLLRRILLSEDRWFLESLNPIYGEGPISLPESPIFIGKIIEKRKSYEN